MARITRALGKKREKREETKQMSLRVPTDLADMFDRYAEEDEVSVTQIGLDAFQNYIEQRGRETRLIEATVNETYDLIANGVFDTVLMARFGVMLEQNEFVANLVDREVREALASERQTAVTDEQVAAIADRVAAMIQPALKAEGPTVVAEPEKKPGSMASPERETRLRRPDEMVAISEDDLAAAGVSMDDLEQSEKDEERAVSRRSIGKGSTRSSSKVSS